MQPPRWQSRQSSLLLTAIFPSYVPHFFSFSIPYKLVVDRLQPLTQIEHGVTLTRQQRIDPRSAFGCQLFEAVTLPLMLYEDRALFFRQLIQRFVQLVQQNTAGVGRLRTALQRWKQVDQQNRVFTFVAIRGFTERLELFAAKAVDNPILRYAKEPRTDLLDRLQQPVGFDQFAENVLKNVFSGILIDHALADVVAKARSIFLDRPRDELILFGAYFIQTQHSIRLR